MPEAIIVILDCSEHMRNGDYSPTRILSEVEAANVLFEAKLAENPENTCGIVTMGGKSGVKLLLTLSQDTGRLLSSTYNLETSGAANLVSALQVAQLTLKNRQSQNHTQRIITFVGSPIRQEKSALKAAGELLKAKRISLDIINFGEVDHNTELLEELLAAAGSEPSHLVTVPSGPHNLTDMILASPIVGAGGAFGVPADVGAGAATGGAAGGSVGGVNADLDPELAAALRESLLAEEERVRRAVAESAAAAGVAPPTAGAQPSGDVNMDEDEELRQALQMSIAESQQASAAEAAAEQKKAAEEAATKKPEQAPAAAAPAAPSTVTAAPPAASTDMELSEEELMEMALQMSLGAADASSTTATAAATAAPSQEQKPVEKKEEDEIAELLQNKEWLAEVLGDLPGVDPSDPGIQEMLRQLAQEKKGGDKK